MMRKWLYVVLCLSLLFSVATACSDDEDKLTNKWQLRRYEFPDGTTQTVDSVFYNFQKGSFSAIIKPFLGIILCRMIKFLLFCCLNTVGRNMISIQDGKKISVYSMWMNFLLLRFGLIMRGLYRSLENIKVKLLTQKCRL